MNKFMETCYKKVEGFLDSCNKFSATQEDAWISDASRELRNHYNRELRQKNPGSYYNTTHMEMTQEQSEMVVRKALEMVNNKCG